MKFDCLDWVKPKLPLPQVCAQRSMLLYRMLAMALGQPNVIWICWVDDFTIFPIGNQLFGESNGKSTIWRLHMDFVFGGPFQQIQDK